ncbi:MAG: hypothetical protein M1461_12360, partial [Nitrospirae bacterium]|nr:hypothetical protein [Nitrospirota bacterium]
LRNALESLRKEGFDVKGFGDMTVEEVAEIAGMRIDEAMMAKEKFEKEWGVSLSGKIGLPCAYQLSSDSILSISLLPSLWRVDTTPV